MGGYSVSWFNGYISLIDGDYLNTFDDSFGVIGLDNADDWEGKDPPLSI